MNVIKIQQGMGIPKGVGILSEKTALCTGTGIGRELPSTRVQLTADASSRTRKRLFIAVSVRISKFKSPYPNGTQNVVNFCNLTWNSNEVSSQKSYANLQVRT